MAYGKGSGGIGAVAVLQGAKVNGHEFPILDLLFAGDAVGHGAVFAGNYDRVKGDVFRPVGQEPVSQVGGHFLFGNAGPDHGHGFREGFIGNALGMAQALQFLLVLHYP